MKTESPRNSKVDDDLWNLRCMW